MKKNNSIVNLALAAMFLGLGLVLPFLTGQIKVIGKMLLPMHIPVLLCGLICGPGFGLTVGAILPIMRSLLFTMPVMYPSAIAMAFELASYGFIIGYLYNKSRWKCIKSLYRSLIASMVGGRVIWGIVTAILFGLKGEAYSFSAFIAGGFTSAIPGIILQLVAIPGIMVALDRTKLVPFSKMKKHHKNLKEREAIQ